MTTKTTAVGPSALLGAIFVLTHRGGAIEMRDLREHFGVGEAALRPALDRLRARGFVQAGTLRLTFAGLMTATQIVSAGVWATDERRAVA